MLEQPESRALAAEHAEALTLKEALERAPQAVVVAVVQVAPHGRVGAQLEAQLADAEAVRRSVVPGTVVDVRLRLADPRADLMLSLAVEPAKGWIVRLERLQYEGLRERGSAGVVGLSRMVASDYGGSGHGRRLV